MTDPTTRPENENASGCPRREVMPRPNAVRGPSNTSKKNPSTVGGRTSGNAVVACSTARPRLRPSTSGAPSGMAMSNRIAVVIDASRSVRVSACQSIAFQNSILPGIARFVSNRSQLPAAGLGSVGNIPARRESEPPHLLLNRRRHQEDQQLFRIDSPLSSGQQYGALLNGSVEVGGNNEVFAICDEPGRACRREGDEARIGVAGVNELGRLCDVLRCDQTRLYRFVNANLFESCNGRPPIGRAIRIRNGYPSDLREAQHLHGWRRQMRILARPQHQRSSRISDRSAGCAFSQALSKPGRDQFLRIPKVRG